MLLAAAAGCEREPVELCDRCILAVLEADGERTDCRPAREDLVPIRDALARVADHLDRTALDEPRALLWLDVVNRQLGGARYADALERYDRALAGRRRNLHTYRLFRRLMDRETPLDPDDLALVENEIDFVTVRALHCDRLDLGADYVERLLEAAGGERYALTHAGLAWRWLQENGCALEVPAGFEAALVDSMAALIDRAEPVTDLEIEAAALLHALGHAERVPPTFIAQVLAAQGPGGGFRMSSARDEEPNFHTGMLAFWLLFQHACPAPGGRPMLGTSACRPGPSRSGSTD